MRLWWIVALAAYTVFAGLALIVVHELAHVLAARLVGYRIYEIRVGREHPFWERTLFGVRCSIGSDFLYRGGYCVVQPPPGVASLRAEFLVLAAPLLVHVALMLVALPFWSTSHYAQVLFVLNAWEVILNGWPGGLHEGAVLASSDGEKLLAILRRPRVTKRRLLVSGYLVPAREKLGSEESLRILEQAPGDHEIEGLRAEAYWRNGRADEALTRLDHWASYRHQGRTELEIRALLRLDRLAEALPLAETAFADAKSPAERAHRGAILSLALRTTDPDRADDMGRRAYELLPWDPAACIATNRLDEARRRDRDDWWTVEIDGSQSTDR
ncbi:MAG: site-2 protease family protein [Planctomycetota bacterium]|jgi:hypothetical protein